MSCDGLTFGDCGCDDAPPWIPPDGGPPWPPPWGHPPPPVTVGNQQYNTEIQLIWKVINPLAAFVSDQIEIIVDTSHAAPGQDWIITTFSGASSVSVEYKTDAYAYEVDTAFLLNPSILVPTRSLEPQNQQPYGEVRTLNFGPGPSFRSIFLTPDVHRRGLGKLGSIFGVRYYWN